MIFLQELNHLGHEIAEMELPCSKFLISPTLTKFPAKYSVGSKILGINSRRLPLSISSKKCSYQDFQEYAKPWRLLAAGGVSSSDEKVSVSSTKFESLYKVRLQTSNGYGSGLSDVNSGILLCLIDENGSSILQRLPATCDDDDDTWRFQRGSIDEFAFEGAHLGRIVAVWISLESGEWRLSGINLRVICGKNEEMKQLQYEFQLEDMLVGEKGDASMIELRPESVSRFWEEVLDESESESESASSKSNEESMKEYAYLKVSLLLYDAVLILGGSALSSIFIGENGTYAFLIGGLLGFAYLLVVQTSVDQLPTENEKQPTGSFKWIQLMVFALVVITVNYASGEEYAVKFKLVSTDIIFGLVGFLMCKLALLLAAFKPITPTLRDNK